MRTLAVPPASGGSTKVVSEKPISSASACIVSGSIPRASVNTASWLPASAVSVKTSTTTYRNVGTAAPYPAPRAYGLARGASDRRFRTHEVLRGRRGAARNQLRGGRGRGVRDARPERRREDDSGGDPRGLSRA